MTSTAMNTRNRTERFLERTMVQLQAGVQEHAKNRRNRRNTVIVLDASPSMEDTDWTPSRMAGQQDAARAYVRTLATHAPSTHIGVVSYHWRAEVLCHLKQACRETKLLRAIDSIEIDSHTNIAAGLLVALRLLKRAPGRHEVLLVTDGDHNVKEVCPESVAERLRKIATIECIGVAGTPADVNAALMKSIASRRPDGSPRYRWIGDKHELVRHCERAARRIARS